MVRLKLTATLKDYTGVALANKPILFFYSFDGATFTHIATVNTNDYGVAETQHETTRTTWYKARFEGDPTYDASEATQVYEVPPPAILAEMPWLLPVILILIILGIGIAVYLARKRR